MYIPHCQEAKIFSPGHSCDNIILKYFVYDEKRQSMNKESLFGNQLINMDTYFIKSIHMFIHSMYIYDCLYVHIQMIINITKSL